MCDLIIKIESTNDGSCHKFSVLATIGAKIKEMGISTIILFMLYKF